MPRRTKRYVKKGRSYLDKNKTFIGNSNKKFLIFSRKGVDTYDSKSNTGDGGIWKNIMFIRRK